MAVSNATSPLYCVRSRVFKCLLILSVISLILLTSVARYGNRSWFFLISQRYYTRLVSQKDIQTFQRLAMKLRMTNDEKNHLFDLINNFNVVLKKYNISYFGVYGSLLGVVRHGGPVPWDDDVDFVIKRRDKVRLESAFATEEKKNKSFPMKLYRHNDYIYKITHRVFTNVSHKTSRRWAWPYLDIFVGKDTGKHIYEPFGQISFDKKEVYPTVFVPYGPIHIHLPRCFLSIAKREYDMDMCCTGKWNHRKEEWAPKPVCIYCSGLRDRYPFATFTSVGRNATRLTLKLRDRVLRNEVLSIPSC